MLFVKQLVWITFLAILTQPYLPWWSISLICFGVAALTSHSKIFSSFLAGFLSVALLWGGYALYIYYYTYPMLTVRISRLITSGNSFKLFLLVAGIGGIIGGLAALCGKYFRIIFRGSRRRSIF